MKFPSTVDINTYKAYINPNNVRSGSDGINSMDLHWETIDSLKDRCIQAITDNWTNFPLFNQIKFPEDQRQLLDSLDVTNPNLKLSDLCTYIKDDDSFWKRTFISRWPHFILFGNQGKKWINVYMEKHLAECLENMKPSEYSLEKVQTLVELCSPYVKELKLNQLQPSLDAQNNHIPFDFLLANLAELKKIELTFDVKSVGKNFILGCSNISDKDIQLLIHGLERCEELEEFHLHSTRLDPEMLKILARALDRHPCLHTFALVHCRCGDEGLSAFIECINSDSFPALKTLILTNNFLSPHGAADLSRILKRRSIEKLDLRLNPITSEGAAAIFAAVSEIPIKELNLACCSLDETISPLLLRLIEKNQTLRSINVSANRLGQKLGEDILKIIGKNKVVQELDIRNSDISYEVKSGIDSSILENRDRNVFKWSEIKHESTYLVFDKFQVHNWNVLLSNGVLGLEDFECVDFNETIGLKLLADTLSLFNAR